MTIKEILNSDDQQHIRALFGFNSSHSDDAVLVKFNLWARKYFPKYFTSGDAPFHHDIDLYNLRCYRGTLSYFVDIAFRGAAKTARTKLFIAFCILNDEDHFRKYIKVLSDDGDNSTQIVTDVYNMMVKADIKTIYPEIFQKTEAKREERMSSFTTYTGVKMVADTVGVAGRGALQDEARPDLIWYEDFENRTTLRSAVKTKAIWDNMEEARTGLAKGGSCIYTCNYISEQGNVHKLVITPSKNKEILITPIWIDRVPTWDRYTVPEIEQMIIDDDDFEGEKLCQPSASKDIMYDRESLERMDKKTPIKEIGGLKIYKEYNPSHRYAGGMDVAGGVGLDSSTSVYIDFDTMPAQVVATFNNNLIKPDVFGDEINREANIFGGCLVAPESNNHGGTTILRLKQLDANLYAREGKDTLIQMIQTKEYGWHTNALTKPKMLFALGKAIEDGLLALNDPDLIREAMSYTRNDLMDKEIDPRLNTRHFDLLIACAIAWQMKDYAEVKKEEYDDFEEEKPLYPMIGV